MADQQPAPPDPTKDLYPAILSAPAMRVAFALCKMSDHIALLVEGVFPGSDLSAHKVDASILKMELDRALTARRQSDQRAHDAAQKADAETEKGPEEPPAG